MGKQRSETREKKNVIRSAWNRLPFRLMYVVAGTFLPLNLLIIGATGIVLNKASEQAEAAYQRELDFTMDQQEQQCARIDLGMNNLVLSCLTPLTLAESSDNMVSYEILEELSEIFQSAGQTGIYYLYDKISGRAFVKYTPSAYTYREMEELKGSAGELSGIPSEWRLCRVCDRYFSYKYFEYTNYQIGFLMDIEGTMGSGLDRYEEGTELYLWDGFSTVRIDGDGVAATDRSWEELSKNSWQYQALSWESETMGMRLLLRLPRRMLQGDIPVFYWVLFCVSFLAVLLFPVLWRVLDKRVVRPIRCLQNAMEQLEKQNLDFRIGQAGPGETDEFRYLYEGFNRMADEVKSSYEKEIKMVQAELDNLRLQVNPHMLLNSFNMIYSLAQSRNFQCIQEFSMYLVEYFRYALKETDSFVTLKKEMDFVESYIGIQKIRFPGAFTSVHNIQPETLEAMVPPLLIQNFVENAMKYALIPGQTIEVLINIRREEEKLLISVCDTGSGIREEVLSSIRSGDVYTDKLGHKHIGIWNCRRRMEVFYGDRASMNIISSRGGGTQVWLELPFLAEDRAERRKGE